MLIVPLLMTILGAAAGSFAALAAERTLRGEGLVFDRSRCRSCKTTLGPADLVPLISFAALRGRCRHCGAPIPPALWQAELAGALFGGAAALSAPDPGRALLLAGWFWALLALAVADLRRFRLPDALMIPAALLGLGLALAGDGTGWPAWDQRLAWALIGATGGLGAFWALRVVYRWRTGRDGMGMGDVLLAGVLGLALGPDRLPLAVLLGALTALVLAGLRAGRKRRPLTRLGRVPFGASLAMAGAAVALFPAFVQFGTMP